MGIFVRAVVTGFGFSLGAALFKRASAKVGLDDSKQTTSTPDADTADGVEDDDSSDS